MTKSEIVSAIYSRIGGFSKKEAADLVDLVFETMKETLGRGEKIKISGFGNFVLRDKRERRGRNPQTGEPLTIDERRVLTFKPSPILKAALNGGVDPEVHEPAPRSGRSVQFANAAAATVDRGQAR
ncbi:MAG: integration host factor subunit alpha [Polyangiales bacterium]